MIEIKELTNKSMYDTVMQQFNKTAVALLYHTYFYLSIL